MSETPPGLLSDVVVLDLTQLVSGAVATMLLADFGARVVKIEPPAGELYRNAGRLLPGPGGETTSLSILRFSRGKESVVIDLKTDGGRDVLRRLIREADVLVENFRPGVLGRLGFSAEDLRGLNPHLVYTSVSGFGHEDLYPSPYADRPAYALIVEAMAGLTHLAGSADGPPVWMGFAMSDIYAGTIAFTGTLAALYGRMSSGDGARVDISMYDAATFMNELAVTTYAATGDVLERGHYAFQSPWGSFPTRDGYVAIAVLSEPQWRALCDVIGNPELGADPRLQSGSNRAKHQQTLILPALTAWTGGLSTAECVEFLLARSVPAAPVNTAADLMACPQLNAREMLVDVEDPVVGTLKLVGNPLKIEPGLPRPSKRIPGLGEHTASVLAELAHVTDDELAELRAAGAVGPFRGSDAGVAAR